MQCSYTKVPYENIIKDIQVSSIQMQGMNSIVEDQWFCFKTITCIFTPLTAKDQRIFELKDMLLS